MSAEEFEAQPHPLIPILGAWAWHPRERDARSDVAQDDLLDSFNGVPTLRLLEAEGHVHLAWRVDGYFVNQGLWLYIALSDQDVEVLDAQEFFQPSFLLLNCEFSRQISWARTLHHRIINRGTIIVEHDTDAMDDILQILPVDPQLLTGRTEPEPTGSAVERVFAGAS